MRLSHHRRGSGEPLVLVHGIGGRWETWEPVLGLLAAEREVIAIDLPGFGESLTLREGAPTVAALTQAVRDFMGGDGFHVAGFSLGGAIALELGRSGAAASACAICPTGFWTPKELSFCRASLQASRSLSVRIEPFVDRLVGSPLGRSVMAQLVAKPGRVPPAEAAHAIRGLALAPGWQATLDAAITGVDAGTALRCPVTVAWGTQDRLLLPRQADRARRVLPTARHEWLRGCGHVPSWDDPERVAEVVLGAAA